MKVISIRNSHGDTEIHKFGCQHVNRRVTAMHRALTGCDPWVDDFETRLEVAESEYGESAGSFYEENGGDDEYDSYEDFLKEVATSWIHFAPCMKDMK